MKISKDQMVGMRFGRIVVMSALPGRKVLCACDCGVQRALDFYGLRDGRTKSCGCLHQEHILGIGDLRRKHGLSRAEKRTYNSWHGARRRCHDPKCVSYGDYGGRGIEMCAEWRADPMAFFRDMGQRPEGHSLERVDVNRGYEPGNCCWLPAQEQTSNMRNNVRIEWAGENLTIAQWSRKFGIGYKTIMYRHLSGRPPEEIFSRTSLLSGSPLRSLPASPVTTKGTNE